MGLDLQNDYDKAKSKISAYKTTVESKKTKLLDPVTVTLGQGDKLPQILQRVRFTNGWQHFMSDVSTILSSLTTSGTTAQRPTLFLYVGRPYFDTTLVKPIWVKTSTVWVDATGTPV